MSLLIDVHNIDKPTEDNFGVQLLRLYAKADAGNKARLRAAFPNMATVYEAWHADPEQVPDLPYDTDACASCHHPSHFGPCAWVGASFRGQGLSACVCGWALAAHDHPRRPS